MLLNRHQNRERSSTKAPRGIGEEVKQILNVPYNVAESLLHDRLVIRTLQTTAMVGTIRENASSQFVTVMNMKWMGRKVL